MKFEKFIEGLSVKAVPLEINQQEIIDLKRMSPQLPDMPVDIKKNDEEQNLSKDGLPE